MIKLGFTSFESNLLQAVLVDKTRRVMGRDFAQPVNSYQSPVDDKGKLGAVFACAMFAEATLCLFGREPGGISISFLRQVELRHFAKVGSNGRLRVGGSRGIVRFRSKVAGKGNFFDAPMNPGFFKSFKGSGLRMRHAGFNAAFRKNPPPPTGLHQQELNAALSHAIANRSDLLACFREPRWLRNLLVSFKAHDT
jgi:hypothetical protein